MEDQTRAITDKREVKVRKKEVKLFISADDMIIYIRIINNTQNKLRTNKCVHQDCNKQDQYTKVN